MSTKCVKCGRATLIDEDRDIWWETMETPTNCDHRVNLGQAMTAATGHFYCGFCFVPVADHPGELCHPGTIVELRAELARLRVLIADAQRCQETAEPGERMKCAMCCNDHIADLVNAVGPVPVEAPPATSDDQCARCGGTRVEPASGDHDTAVHRDNPYTGEPCSACQQAPATEIGHEKPNSRKLSLSGEPHFYVNGDDGYKWLTCDRCEEPLMEIDAGTWLIEMVNAVNGHECAAKGEQP